MKHVSRVRSALLGGVALAAVMLPATAAAAVSSRPLAVPFAGLRTSVAAGKSITYSTGTAGYFLYEKKFSAKRTISLSAVVTLPTTVTCPIPDTDHNNVAIGLYLGATGSINDGIYIDASCNSDGNPNFSLDDEFYSKRFNGQGPCSYGTVCPVNPNPGDSVALTISGNGQTFTVTWDDLTSSIPDSPGSDSSSDLNQNPASFGFGLLNTGYPLPTMSPITMSSDLVTVKTQKPLGMSGRLLERTDWGSVGAVDVATSTFTSGKETFVLCSAMTCAS